MKCQHCNAYDIPKPVHIEGTTMTVPGLAPTLQELIQSNLANGEPFPLTSRPMYDESDEQGLARSMSRQAPMSDVFAHFEEESAKGEDKNEPAKSADEPPVASSQE